MCGMMFNLERSIIGSEQWSAYPKPDVMPSTIIGVLEDWYSDVDAEHVIDKSREWALPEHWQVLQRNLSYEPKAIVPVRTITEILASFISLVHKNPETPSFIDKEIEVRQEFNFYRPVDDTRCDHLMRPKGLIDNAMFGLAFALHPDNKHMFHFVEYDNLVENPEREITAIYDFLEIPFFSHDYQNIFNAFPEDDKIFGLDGMHDVRANVSRRAIDPAQVLSPYVLGKYSNMEFWR
jgi:sulfotransferase